MIYHEKEKFKIQKLIKTWNNAKNILEKDIDEIKQNFNKLIPEQFIKEIWKWLWKDIKWKKERMDYMELRHNYYLT